MNDDFILQPAPMMTPEAARDIGRAIRCSQRLRGADRETTA